jgi:cation diffusion facilitator family transporter
MTEMTKARRARVEQRALWIGAWSGLAMGGLGLGFGLLTRSEAIMLDGLFSVVGFAIALATIRVSQMVQQPASPGYQFGFSGYEPLINLTKGLVIGFVALFALVSSVDAIRHGGREVQAGWATIYAVVAAGGCAAVAAMLRAAARRSGSPLLQVDVKNWIVDGLLSAAVAVAFLAAFLLRDSGLAWLVPYADPGLVVLLVLLIAPMPVRTAWMGFRELMGGAPEPGVQQRVHDLLAGEFAELADVKPWVRMLKAGRLIYVQIYLLVPDEVEIGSVALLDQVRGRIYEALKPAFPDLSLDVLFTGGHERWLRASIASGPPRLEEDASDAGNRDRSSGVEGA